MVDMITNDMTPDEVVIALEGMLKNIRISVNTICINFLPGCEQTVIDTKKDLNGILTTYGLDHIVGRYMAVIPNLISKLDGVYKCTE